MEVRYNVKHKFKANSEKSDKEIKDIFNKKLLNVILKLENQEFILKTS